MTEAEYQAYRAQALAVAQWSAQQLARLPGPSAGPGRGADGWRKAHESTQTLALLVVELLDEVKTKH